MMRIGSKKTVVVVLTTTMLATTAATTAQAHVQARGWKSKTSMILKKIQHRKPAHKGVKTRFKGSLRSKRPSCKRNKFVHILVKPKGFNKFHKVKTIKTPRERGKYKFTLRLQKVGKGTKVRAKFNGTVRHVHPGTRICLPSKNTISVRVVR
jgi:hypothetical protein